MKQSAQIIFLQDRRQRAPENPCTPALTVSLPPSTLQELRRAARASGHTPESVAAYILMRVLGPGGING